MVLVYLGPGWDQRTQAANALGAFLRQRGGAVDVKDLRPLYAEIPFMKAGLGSLEAFCRRHSCFVFERRSKGTCAWVSLSEHASVAAVPRQPAESLAPAQTPPFFSRARHKWRALSRHPHRTKKRHGRQFLWRSPRTVSERSLSIPITVEKGPAFESAGSATSRSMQEALEAERQQCKYKLQVDAGRRPTGGRRHASAATP